MVKHFCLLAIVHYLKTTYVRKQATAVGLEKDIVYSVRQRKIPTRNGPNSEYNRATLTLFCSKINLDQVIIRVKQLYIFL